jgi:hypothetical protein
MRELIRNFFDWYEKHLLLNMSIALGLFLLQLVHLYWLFADVIMLRLTGNSLFPLTGIWQSIIVLVDYTEIPALIGTSLIYINELRKKWSLKSFLFILLLSSQFLHMFWITDEFVISQFTGADSPLNIPGWLAWVAIAIDYLEIPVIIDTTLKIITAIRKRDPEIARTALKEK